VTDGFNRGDDDRNHCVNRSMLGGNAAPQLDSERVEPFVDISGLFAEKCPQ
jgi:hypothetical protein